MTAQPDVLEHLKEAEEEGNASLLTPDAQLAFTQNIRFLRARYEGEVGAHYDQQSQVWGVGVNETAASQHLQDIEAGTVKGDLGLVSSAVGGLTDARLAQARLTYGTLTPQMIDAVRGKAAGEAIETQVKTLLPTDPARAARIVEANADKLPAGVYEMLSRATKDKSDEVGLTANLNGYMTGQTPARAPSGGPATPAPLDTGTRARAQAVHDAVVADGGTSDEGWGWAANAVHESAANPAPQPFPEKDGSVSHGLFSLNKDQLTAYQAAHNGHLPEQDSLQTQVQWARSRYGVPNVQGPDAYARVISNNFEIPANGPQEAANRAATAVALSGAQPAAAPASGGVAPASYSPGEGPSLAGGTIPVAAPVPGSQPPVAAPGLVAHNPAGVDMLAQKYIGAADTAAKLYPNNPLMQKRFVDGIHQQVNELMMLQNRDEAVRKKQRKDAAEAAGQAVLTTLHKNPSQFDPALIWNQSDSVMTWEEKQHLAEVANYQLTQAGVDTVHHAAGYTKVLAGITADPNDPNYIGSMRDIWSRAGDGGDLNRRDADELSQIFTKVHKDPDEATIRTRESSMLTYAKRRLTFPDVTVAPGFQITDRAGEDVYNAQFLQAYTQDVDKAVATGKPEEINKVLNKDYVDKMAAGMRSQADIDKARLSATGQLSPTDVEKPGTPIPPPPTITGQDGKPVTVNSGAWQTVMVRPPNATSGVPYTHKAWADVLQRMLSNPEQGVKDFDTARNSDGSLKFAGQGYDGATLLKALTAPVSPVPTQEEIEPLRGPY